MNIDQLSRLPNGVQIIVGAAELKEFALELLAAQKELIEEEFSRADKRRSLTPTEVCELCGCTRSTLWRWTRKGVLTPSRVGGKVLYDSEELRKVLTR